MEHLHKLICDKPKWAEETKTDNLKMGQLRDILKAMWRRYHERKTRYTNFLRKMCPWGKQYTIIIYRLKAIWRRHHREKDKTHKLFKENVPLGKTIYNNYI